jgi:transcription initiation factor TFIIIB Brf1 subunit/transcription initiation factor TFIIB
MLVDEEIFDNPDIMASAFEATFFAQAEVQSQKCTHVQIKTWSDGRGYCIDCGAMFSDTKNIQSDLANCKHESTHKIESGVTVCSACGNEFGEFDFTQEWRYYGTSDNRTSQDPSRCHSHKSAPKGIDSVFQKKNVQISDYMKGLVEYKYKKIMSNSNEELNRGKGRTSITAACLFYAYQDIGEYRTAFHIIKMFGITQKDMSMGRTKYLESFPDDAVKHITPEKLLPWLMKEVGVDVKYYKRILAITRYLSATSQLIERSTPQSIASGIIYFYLCLDRELKSKMRITKAEFAKKVDLTEITITKIVKEIASVSKEVIDLQ